MSYCHRLILLGLALVTLWTFYGPSPASVAAATATSAPSAAGHLMPQPQAGCQNSITVSTTADSGAGSLRQALTDVCSGGTVSFAAGLHDQTITLTTAELSITKTVTITNPNAANLKVSGNNARRVFNIQAGAVVTISSLSVISGTAPVSCYFGFESCGGGIQVNSGATLNVISSTFSNNMASRGGGIYNEGILTLKNSIFNSNSASMGGGLYNKNVLIMNNSTLSNNSGGSYGGGGIYVEYTAIFTVTNSTLNNNSASSGGAVTNYGVLVLNAASDKIIGNVV